MGNLFTLELVSSMVREAKGRVMLLLTIPHSGEGIPASCHWLSSLPKDLLLADVDRFVHELYAPFYQQFSIPTVVATFHRYAVDLNRDPEDVDQESVVTASAPAGTHPHGFHWVKTMEGKRLLFQPLTRDQHVALVEQVYRPFHEQVERYLLQARQRSQRVWLLDLHSMPSVGTQEHRDPGHRRADIVISDFHGSSADVAMVNCIITQFVRAGFKVAYNWPYYGGKLTQKYGSPQKGVYAVQIELNRALYMDESTKEKNQTFAKTQALLNQAMQGIYRDYIRYGSEY